MIFFCFVLCHVHVLVIFVFSTLTDAVALVPESAFRLEKYTTTIYKGF